MISDQVIMNNLNNTVTEVNLPGLGKFYKGKVRDNYTNEDKEERIIIVSDRLSAFDVVLDTIPFKGQVLNQLATYWFGLTKEIAKSHFIKSPDPNVVIVKLCTTYPVEVVVRGYITGSLWREHEKGEDNYGLGLQDLKKDQKLDEPIITPSTKAEEGHDLPMKREDVLKIIPEEIYNQMEKTALKLFKRGQEVACQRGLILVDTKYEFGKTKDGEVLVIDEIHTPDSSRYWIKDEYEERFSKGESQHMLDKEFVRQWLISKGYMGNGTPPILTDEVKASLAKRYIQLYERITGKEFQVVEGDVQERIKKNLIKEGFTL